MLLYVAGPYRGQIDENIGKARTVAIAIWRAGHVALCPHLNTANFEAHAPELVQEIYLEGDYAMLARCDGIVMVPGWEGSEGARAELAYARRLQLPEWHYPDLPAPHPTEKSYPAQCRAFLETVMRMYRLHLDKNADYSPANILATGEIGLVTRLWDKIARLLNLYGFRFRIEAAGTLEPPRQPKHEAVDDTFLDAAVYSIIGLLVRQKAWGR